MRPALAKDFHQQLRRTIHDLGMLREVRVAVDPARKFHNAPDFVQASELRVKNRQRIERALSSALLPLVDGDPAADLSLMHELPVPHCNLTGRIYHVAGSDRGHK